jgi:hypothetical protein
MIDPVGLGLERVAFGLGLLEGRERLGLHAGLLRARGGDASARDAYGDDARAAAEAAIGRWAASHAPPRAEVLAAAPEALREIWAERAAILGAEGHLNAEGAAWAVSWLGWETPRWTRREVARGGRWTHGAALMHRGVEVARVVAVCEDEEAGLCAPHRWAALWARTEAGAWRPAARIGRGPCLLAWAGRAAARLL